MQAQPSNEHAEKTLLGTLMLYGRHFEAIEGLVAATDFYDRKHEAVFLAMESLRSRSEPIDMVTTSNELRRMGLIDRLGFVGNEAYLVELTEQVTTADSIEAHARLVRDKSILRRIILETSRISAMAYRDDRPVGEVLDLAQSAVLGLGELTDRKEPKPFRQVLHTAITTLQERARNRTAVTGVPSGIYGLDELTGGFQPGHLIVIAGRPGMGKTAAVESFALHAVKRGYPCLMFSLEMTDEELGQRAMSAEAGIDGANMRTGLLRDVDWVGLTNAVSRMKDFPFWIDDDGKQDLLSISSISRRWRKNPKIFPPSNEPMGSIVVDYMQLIEASVGKRHHSREREVAEISAGLKALAKELHVPVIALAQLNRKCEDRTDKRPIMSDLKESGSIEQDANMVLLLYRDEVYNKGKEHCEEGVAEIIIGKHRGGPTGTVKAKYIKEQTRFANLSNRME